MSNTNLNGNKMLELTTLLSGHLAQGCSTSIEVIGGVTITSMTISITPELAQTLIGSNIKNNRKLNNQFVKQFAAAMLNGTWRFYNDPIHFDWDGFMNNGQHRLRAIIMSGVTSTFRVSIGYDPATCDDMDQGKIRTLVDVTEIAGHSTPRLVSNTANFIFKYKNNSLNNSKSATSGHVTLKNHNIAGYIKQIPKLFDSVDFQTNLPKNNQVAILENGIVAGLHYLFSEKDPVMAEVFLTKLMVGDGLASGSPILAVRNRLSNAKMDKGRSITHADKIRLTIAGWNKYRKNITVKGGIRIKDEFPVII